MRCVCSMSKYTPTRKAVVRGARMAHSFTSSLSCLTRKLPVLPHPQACCPGPTARTLPHVTAAPH